jgi:SpoU rRNA methylase family enzyme
MKELYKFFKYNGKVVDIENFNDAILNIFSREVLSMIENNEDGWEKMLPPGVSEIIKEKHLFSCQNDYKTQIAEE